MICQSINQAVFLRVPPATRRLLDVGCGGGVFGGAAALPNVLFWKQRLQFMSGRFRYTEGGLIGFQFVFCCEVTDASRQVHAAGHRDSVAPMAHAVNA